MLILGYLYLAIALMAGLTKGYCGKKVSTGANCLSDGMCITALRMILCAALGLAVVLTGDGISVLKIGTKDLLVCILSAVCMAAFNGSWLFSVKNQSYMFLNIFLMLGSIITTICSSFAFSEAVSPTQWIGMIILLSSVFVMSGYNTRTMGKMSIGGVTTLIVCALASCFADFSQKLYVKTGGGSVAAFQFYTYLFAFILLVITSGISCRTEKRDVRELVPHMKKMAAMIVIMSVCLYLNSTFKTMAAGILPTAQLYPVLQSLNLIMSAAMAHFLMKEKITNTSLVGVALALVGILIVA